MRQDLATLDTLDGLIAEVEAELRRLSTTAPWAEQVPYLVQLSGIGVLAAMTLLAGIGDITRFPRAKDLVGYAGLGAGVHDTGQTHQGGRITKQGRRELRGCMVEAAWVAVAHQAHWKAACTRLCTRMSAQKAIVAIARKLLVVVWHVLSEHAAERRGEPAAMARALWLWQARCGAVPGRKRPLRQIVRREVERLGLDVRQITRASGRPLMLLATAERTPVPVASSP